MNSKQTGIPSAKENIPAWIISAAEDRGNHVALVAAGGLGESISYADLASRIRAAAGGLKSLGLRRLDCVALLSENCPDWAICYLAIQAAGATVVPLDAMLKPAEHLSLLHESSPKAIILSTKFHQSLGVALKQEVPGLQVILSDSDAPGCVSLSELYSGSPYLCSDIEPDQPAALIFTSGTTGKPKAVILTHKNILSNIKGIFKVLRFTPADRFLSVLPLSHVYECTAGFLTALVSGSSIVYARSLAGPSIIEDMRRASITILIGVPLLYEKMRRGILRRVEQSAPMRRALFQGLYGLSSFSSRFGLRTGKSLFAGLREKAGMKCVRLMVSGGAPLDTRIANFFGNLGFNFIEGYGMTECSPVISFNSLEKNVVGSVGPPLPGLEVVIDSPNQEGVGEILVRGESVTPGYLGDAKKTAQVLRDGWLVTGDLGRLSGGALYICGRAKNLIVSAGGKNIYPEEIEGKLLESGLIAEALVLGRKKKGGQGEEVRALLFPDLEEMSARLAADQVANQSDELRERLIRDVVESVNEHLADYKRISSWEIVEREFEKTASKKIKRSTYV